MAYLKDLLVTGPSSFIEDIHGNNIYANSFIGSLNGNAATATKLVTPRNLQVALGSTTTVTFDGSADQNSIPVSGILAVSNGGTGVNRLIANYTLVGNETGGIKASSKFQIPVNDTGTIQTYLPIKINGGEDYSNNVPGVNASPLVIYKPDNNYPAIELYRHASSGTSTKASWQLINENGTFKIKNNWGKVSNTATTRTENSTYTETLLTISPGTEDLTNEAGPAFTAYAPIKIVHTAGKSRELEIVYNDVNDSNNNIDFSLMVGNGNVNHGLYDYKKGSGAWILSTDSTHNWTFNGSASKWITARTITKAGDLQGNFSLDGSGNVTDTAYISYIKAIRNNSNSSYCYHRILTTNGEISSEYYDASAILILNQGFIGGKYGIARVVLRTNKIVTNPTAPSVEITWLVRKGFYIDDLQFGLINNNGKATADIYLKETSEYGGTFIRVLQDFRATAENRWIKINSESNGTSGSIVNTEVYTSVSSSYTKTENNVTTIIPYTSTSTSDPTNATKDVGIVQTISSTLTVNKGGTGQVALGTNCVLVGNGTNNIKASSQFQIPVNDTGTITASLPLHLTNTTAATATLLSSQLIIGNSKNAPALELYRTESNSASWQLINDTGTFKIKNNYKNDIAGDYDNDSAFAISWKTGHVTVGGGIYPRTAGDKNLGSDTTQWNNIYANQYYIKSGSNSYNSIISNAETNIYFNIKNGNNNIIPLVITNTEVRRGTSASAINLGSSTYKWANIYTNQAKIGDYLTIGANGSGNDAKTISSSDTLYINSGNACSVIFQGNSNNIALFDQSANYAFRPDSNQSRNLGTSSYRWGALYIGTANSYGATNTPIYWNNGVPATINLNLTANNLINNLSTGSSIPVDNDYFISQYVEGGTSTITYHRRPISKLYEYIRNKAATSTSGMYSIIPTTNNTYNLGSSDNKWKNIYAKIIESFQLNTSNVYINENFIALNNNTIIFKNSDFALSTGLYFTVLDLEANLYTNSEYNSLKDDSINHVLWSGVIPIIYASSQSTGNNTDPKFNILKQLDPICSTSLCKVYVKYTPIKTGSSNEITEHNKGTIFYVAEINNSSSMGYLGASAGNLRMYFYKLNSFNFT